MSLKIFSRFAGNKSDLSSAKRKGENASSDKEAGAFSCMFGVAVSEDTSPTWAPPVTAAGVDHTMAQQTRVVPYSIFGGTTGWN